jgi:hypothetical protein
LIFEPFLAHLASKFEKSTNMTFKKIFWAQIKKGVKKRRIVVKKCTKKSYMQNKFDEHE